ncbi:hypothetical protein L1887_47646 [Cichorium endivia]|nr:hypothetical protein L1887_47646 [Cichorium endivia]
MSSLPTVLIGEGIKYLSGLNIVIDFGHSVDARKYLEDIGRWINEKVLVEADGEKFKLSMVNYIEDWSPFTPLTVESEEEDEDSEGVSDT